MKLITFVVPCYNSEDYMAKCVNSLLPGGDQVEIVIVNDGSTDSTAAIANTFQIKYPNIVKVVHKENGGHGDAVCAGLKEASGYYFKVVDSDDWLEERSYKAYLHALKSLHDKGTDVDMFLTDFTYYKLGVRHKKVMRYKSALPQNRIFTWEDGMHINHFQYILMHSVTFRTQVLIDSKLELPKHTFYVDNIYLFHTLPYVRTMYYLDVPLYQYFIGREDQSVNESVMVRRIDQQIFVNKEMIRIYNECGYLYPKQESYMLQYFDMMMCVASIMLIIGGEPEHLAKKKELWQYLKKENPALYKKMRYSIFGITMNLPGRVGRFLSKTGYHVMNKIFGFN